MAVFLETVVQLNDGKCLQPVHPISNPGSFLTDIMCFPSSVFLFASLGCNTSNVDCVKKICNDFYLFD